MKYFTFLLCFALSVAASAQLDITQSDTSRYWFYSHDPCSLNGCTHNETAEHFLGHDTVVHGVTYALTYDGLQKRCIREDARHRVYGLDDNDTVETLLFDFGAVTGDTIYFRGFFQGATHNYYYIIDTVDSFEISLGSGVYRRAWHVSTNLDTVAGPGFKLTWIEGIGEEYNGLHSVFARDFTTGFSFCGVYQDSAYVFSVYQRCYEILGIIGTPASERLRVYPTPAAGVINIENNTGERLTHYTLADLSGQSLVAADFAGQDRSSISLPSLPAGIYLLMISDDKGNVYKQKVVKK